MLALDQHHAGEDEDKSSKEKEEDSSIEAEHAYFAALALEPMPPEPVAVGPMLFPRLPIKLCSICQLTLPIFHCPACRSHSAQVLSRHRRHLNNVKGSALDKIS